MTSPWVVLSGVGLLCLASCGRTLGNPLPNAAGETQETGASGAAPSAGTGASGAASTASTSEGGTTTAGASGSSVGASANGGSSGGAAAGAGSTTSPDILEVWPSDGCGQQAQSGVGTVGTMGTKDNDCSAKLLDGQPRCGPWGQPASTWLKTPLQRSHHVYLPQGYDALKSYALVLQAPGCSGSAVNVYDLSTSVSNTVIRVGIDPPDSIIGHGTNPEQGCFDDKEGDDSVDWVHYEALYDELNQELCFDRNRVFASGNSSGAWWANELGCKYAGDATRPVRGVVTVQGGLPQEPRYKPTCSTKPLAGVWVYDTYDLAPSSADKFAIARAMAVNECAADSYESAVLEDYSVTDRPVGECKRITGCSWLTPMVVCAIPGPSQSSHAEIINPTAAQFLRIFQTAPYIVP
jgi:hypothetical protein